MPEDDREDDLARRHELAEPAKEGSFSAWRPLVIVSALAIALMVAIAIAYILY